MWQSAELPAVKHGICSWELPVGQAVCHLSGHSWGTVKSQQYVGHSLALPGTWQNRLLQPNPGEGFRACKRKALGAQIISVCSRYPSLVLCSYLGPPLLAYNQPTADVFSDSG